MTKKELDQYIKNVLKKAESSQEEKGNIDEIIFEFYKTVAAHYNNTVPQSIYKVFITNVPTFEKYLKNVMDPLHEKAYKKFDEKRTCESDIRDIQNQLTQERYQIHVGLPYEISKLYREEQEIYKKTISDKEYLENLLDFMITETTKQSPEELGRALYNLYQMQTVEIRHIKYVDPYIHSMFLEKYPPFIKYLEEHNQQEFERIHKELDGANKRLSAVQIEINDICSKLILVYDDSPKKKTIDEDPCGWHTRREYC